MQEKKQLIDFSGLLERLEALEKENQQIKSELRQIRQELRTVPIFELCKMPEAERILGYKAKKIRQMIESGKVEADKLYNGHYVFNRQHLQDVAPKLRLLS